MGVPPNQPFIDGFSLINHPFWVPSFSGDLHMGLSENGDSPMYVDVILF